MKRVLTLALFVVCVPAFGQVWTEVGDAPELPPGQITIGAGALTSIVGETSSADLADMYCIRITDEATFSASTVGLAGWDTALFLFDVAGMGVSFSDDSTGIESTITSTYVSSNGIYFLAISGWEGPHGGTEGHDPISAGGEIWLDIPYTERAPDGPGAAGAITGWADSGTFGRYGIALTGASYCAPVPEPFTMGIAGLALATAARRRLRKSA